MRVIAGTSKGTRLLAAPPGTRPVSEVAREGLFSSLGDLVEGARCLDLFAGGGSLGIEALSRGAASCRFVERARPAAAVIRQNLALARLADRAEIRVEDVGSFLRKRSNDDPRFDLVLLDPPYELTGPALDGSLAALDHGWLADEHWTVAVTRGHKSPLPAVPVHWAARRHLRYGDSLVILYREVGWA
jgi:16S rRNA (guanine966-N2)-methyltransferase